jgi:OmcA/MtrC family decaheme c-type cytochrome
VLPRFSRLLPGVMVTIDKISDTAPGRKPVVEITVKDNAGNPINSLSRLSFRVAGPTADYPAVISEDARTARGNNGKFIWTFVNALPADARGTFGLSVEARTDTTVLQGTRKEQVIRDTAKNVNTYFTVDGSQVVPRRTVVSTAKCDSCHGSLAFHGDARNTVENCAFCHNPTLTAGTGAAAVSLNFNMMIHRIHRGNDLTRPYAIGNTSFNEAGYPGDRRNCEACHVNGSEQLPLSEALLNPRDPAGPMQPLRPTAAACSGCHDSRAAAAHMVVNTNAIGESCVVCHGPNANESVNRAHAR